MIYACIGVGVLYLIGYVYTREMIVRLSFWNWPYIWAPGKDKVLASLFALLPVMWFVICISERRLYWAPIPDKAFRAVSPSKKDDYKDRATEFLGKFGGD